MVKEALRPSEIAPKRARSSYTLYSKDRFPALKALGKTNPECIKFIAAGWNELGQKDKSRYAKLADEDKARYAKELESYDGPPIRNKTKKREAKLKAKKIKMKLKSKKTKKALPVTSASLQVQLRQAIENEKKAKAQWRVSHAALSMAKAACATITPELDQKLVDSGVTKSTAEVTRLAIEAINEMAERGGSTFVSIKQHINEVAPGLGGASLGKLLSTALLNDAKFAKISAGKYRTVKRKPKRAYKGRKKYIMAENGVKRPKAPFMWFMASKRKELKTSNPEMKPTAVAIEVGRLWRQLPTKDRAPFVAEGDEDKKRYEKERAAAIAKGPKPVAQEEDGDDDDEEEAPAARRSTRR